MLCLPLLLASCFKTEEIPLLVYDGEATHTIAEFESLHTLGANATLITEDIVICGTITSTDEFGSCYKEIFIQDSTGGISFKTANSSYFHKYRIGQTVYIKCKDLYLGSYISNSGYSGWYQLGLWGNGELQYIPTSYDKAHIFRSGVPNEEPTPKLVTNASQLTTKDFHTLITLVNCSFIDADGTATFYNPDEGYSATSRNIQLQEGYKYIIARTSQYADFALTAMPTGMVNVTGVLTKYGDDYQLVIRSIDDVMSETVATYSMTSNPFEMGWTVNNVQGNNSWIYNSSYKAVTITGENGVSTESWLISPTLDFSNYDVINLLVTQQNFNGMATADNLKIKYSIDNGSSWTELPVSSFPSSFTTTSISLPNEAIQCDHLKIGFQYIDNQTSTWSISNIVFKTIL